MKKIFLLFGSTGTLGKEAVKYFTKQKYDQYYIFSRKHSKSNKKNFITVEDLTKEENVAKGFSQIKRSKNNFYYLLNTIGGYRGGKSISETSLDDWNNMIDLNLTSSFLIAKHFAHLVKTGLGGSLCMISAATSLHPKTKNGAYSISKNGINHLTKILSIEGKEINLSANAIAPFAIDSPENREWIDDKSMLVSPMDICILAQKIFTNKELFSGKIIELPFLSK